MKVNGKSLPENFDKTSTLPASFRRRDEEVVMTGTLPRNLNRNQSFSKRFRKSCKNWAAQRGLIDPCKADNQTETKALVKGSENLVRTRQHRGALLTHVKR